MMICKLQEESTVNAVTVSSGHGIILLLSMVIFSTDDSIIWDRTKQLI